MLQMLSEETIPEEGVDQYFSNLYRIVCVAEKPAAHEDDAELVRTTYVVDWEQLVHLLEDYDDFGEDIVEVTPVRGDEACSLRRVAASPQLARA